MEHVILAFVRWQDVPSNESSSTFDSGLSSAASVGGPTCLKYWIRLHYIRQHTRAVTLASFFATLSPPLHCVRCHGDYTDIENSGSDRSCRVPHDDDNAEVKWAGHKCGNSDYDTYYGWQDG
jgi:hypothetical protein